MSEFQHFVILLCIGTVEIVFKIKFVFVSINVISSFLMKTKKRL